METFWKYAYFSHIVVRSDEDFHDILDTSRQNNLKNGVTGILVRDKKMYFQYLEGRKKAVAECLLRIAGDSRHNEITSVVSANTQALLFDGWSLADAKLPQRKQNLSAFKRLLISMPMDDRIAIVDEVCLGAKLSL